MRLRIDDPNLAKLVETAAALRGQTPSRFTHEQMAAELDPWRVFTEACELAMGALPTDGAREVFEYSRAVFARAVARKRLPELYAVLKAFQAAEASELEAPA